jgi:hypothetical protein
MTADQSRLLANYEADQAKAEETFKRIFQQLNEGTYPNAALAPAAALAAIKYYSQILKNHVAVIRTNSVAGVQGPFEKTRISLQANIEEARGRERVKQLTWTMRRLICEASNENARNYGGDANRRSGLTSL